MGNSVSLKRTARRFDPLRILKIFGFALLALNGLLRVQQTLAYWNMLQQLQVWPGGGYLALTGVGLFAAGLIAALALWQRWRQADAVAAAAALLSLAWAWVDRLALSRSPNALTNAPFLLVFSLAVAAVMLWPFAANRKKEHREYR